MGRLLDVEQAAKRLGVCRETVRRRIRKGKLKAESVGAGDVRKTYRIQEENLVDSMETPEEGVTITTRDGT